MFHIYLTFIGLIILLESSYGNSNRHLRQHIAEILDVAGHPPGLGINRFELLRTSLHPTIDEIKLLTNILVKNSQEYVFIIFVYILNTL
jgi:hypothetical protein